jgi:predicted metal-dependent phosphoesterase TrpH
MFSDYDLHSHSTASDGTLSPTELVEQAAGAGVRVMALTDHDTTEGVDEARRAAARLRIGLIAGVEISVTWQAQTIHILGLNVDVDDQRLQRGLAGLRAFRQRRAQRIAEGLVQAGIPDAYAGARELADGGLISRTHFARYLVQLGLAADERQVFRHYLVKGKPGHVAGEWAELAEALDWIHQAGGQAVIAHPARYRLTRSKLRRLLQEFVALNGAAIEVVSGSHSRDDYHVMAKHAQDFGLSASAGSDFHSPEYPWIKLGKLPQLPDGCRPIWRDWPAIGDRVSG